MVVVAVIAPAVVPDDDEEEEMAEVVIEAVEVLGKRITSALLSNAPKSTAEESGAH